MHLDVIDLRQFYYRTRLGRVAQQSIRKQLSQIWSDASGQTVVGFGFAAPLLRPYLSEARRVVGLMPGPQGVMHWPAGMPNVSVLCSELNWPIETGAADKLIVLHGLETSENPTSLLQECWRVLAPGGRAVFVVPNRAGLWARRDRTPFGFGRPYSLGQLESQLKAQSFVPEQHRSVLFIPPSEKRFWLRSSAFWEGVGQRVAPMMTGGVFLVEVSKQVFLPRRHRAPETLRRPLRVLEGLPGTEPKPV